MTSWTVLVVDDDTNTLRSLEFVLSAAGFNVLTAANGVIALHLMLDAIKGMLPIRLILTDIQMPMLSGLEFIDQIRRLDAAIPIVAITAYRDRNLERELGRRGCTQILDKPLDDESLVACLQVLSAGGGADGTP